MYYYLQFFQIMFHFPVLIAWAWFLSLWKWNVVCKFWADMNDLLSEDMHWLYCCGYVSKLKNTEIVKVFITTNLNNKILHHKRIRRLYRYLRTIHDEKICTTSCFKLQDNNTSGVIIRHGWLTARVYLRIKISKNFDILLKFLSVIRSISTPIVVRTQCTGTSVTNNNKFSYLSQLMWYNPKKHCHI